MKEIKLCKICLKIIKEPHSGLLYIIHSKKVRNYALRKRKTKLFVTMDFSVYDVPINIIRCSTLLVKYFPDYFSYIYYYNKYYCTYIFNSFVFIFVEDS